MTTRRIAAARPGRALLAVLCLGVALRAVLLPLGHGEDFVVWDKTSAALLHGGNFYADHPGYPHGPFAYIPLFAYLELPFRWVALHSDVSFTILGKLPIAAADLACALLIAAELRRHGAGERRVAAGAALYFLNPLVLYNSAYYGRFDALGCALLLMTLRLVDSRQASGARLGVWYGLAIASKTFPVFLLPGVLRQAGRMRGRVLLASGAVVLLLSLPFLTTPVAFFQDLVLHDVTKAPFGLSWQYLLNAPLGERGAKLLSYVLLLVFAVGAVRLRHVADRWWNATLTLVLFMLCSKLVLEQYLTWAMPWLILIGLSARDSAGRSCLAVLAAFTLIGVIDNESWHPLGRSSWPVNLVLTLVCAAHVAIGVQVHKRRTSPAPPATAGKSRTEAEQVIDQPAARLRDADRLARR